MSRIGEHLSPISPTSEASGIRGHLWEQFVLPFRLDTRLLWNPTCPGPVAVRNQVVTVHDLSSIEHPEWFDWKYALWNRALIPLVLRRARQIITVSNYTQERLHDLLDVPRQKMTTIYNGVDDRFEPRPDSEVTAMREALDLPCGPYVLSLSALQPRKNLQRLLHAWSRLSCDDTSLVLAGGAGRPTIFHGFSLDSVPSNVHLTGYVDDEWLPALYTGARVFAYPSLYEGFGLPVLEAMACGTPVITSDRTSLPEVAGDGALLANPLDVDDISTVLHRLLHDDSLRRHLSKQGQKRGSEFQWEKTASETLSVLKQSAQAL
jgi:glycosyltransferase involved in cell wall biosynthesis